ncbi:hypothetical protein, partial [Nocardia neocaledoniensis]|uniref:hypothetical protein n=1 Tax=Nocardia neocaledoniensis TaxID=236511 RepID=UPI00245509FD
MSEVAMVEVEIDGNTVTVNVLGGHRLLALRQQVVIDRAAITGITPAEVDLRPPWVRAPGTFIPGVIAAGVYRGKGRKEFWDTTFGGNAVRIDLDGYSAADCAALLREAALSALRRDMAAA